MAFSDEYYDSLSKVGFAPTPIKGSYETLGDLENDPQYQEDAEKYLTYLAANTKGWRKFLDAGSWGGNDDIFEVLRDEDWRLGTISTRGGLLEEAPQEIKDSYKRLRSRFDGAAVGDSDQWFRAIKDIGIDVLADPINIATLIASGGAGFVGTSAVAKKAIPQTLLKLATQNSTKAATVRGAMAGSTFAGMDNYYRQNAELASGLRNDFSTAENVAYSAGGGLLGGVLGKYFGVTEPSKTRQKSLASAVDEDLIKTKIDDDIDPEIFEESFSFAENALGRGVVIDGDFEEILEEQIDIVTKKFDAGDTTKGELYDAVRKTIQENQGATGEKIKSELQQEVSRVLHGIIPRTIGKPASILDRYTKFSKTAQMLQKKFRYDLGRSLFGKREVEGRDFFETFNDLRGDRLMRIRDALDPFNVNLKGQALDDAKDNIVKVLRGNTRGQSDITIKAADEIKAVLDEIGVDLKAYGVMDDLVEDYFPRMWDRKTVERNRTELEELLVNEEASFMQGKTEIKFTSENVGEFVDGMLDIKNRIDNGKNSSFFSSRTINIDNDSAFDKFLDNNLDSILNTYTAQTSKTIAKTKVFGVRDAAGFEKLWIDEIAKEMKAAGKKEFTATEKEAILNVYKTATGEGLQRFDGFGGHLLDGYVLGTRIALLPLATLSSLTEIAINISRAGFKNSTKGFAKAFKSGFKTITDDTVDDLLTKGLTKAEAFKEMNRVHIAMDQALAEGAERLSGDALNKEWARKGNNAFFRFNFLDQWTKAVQLASFTTAKELINDNLGKIAATIDAPVASTQRHMDELIELGLDIDKALDWYKAGAKRSDDFYQNDVLKAAGRYTNEIILNPSPEAGLKPNLMSNPKTSIFFQLMGYPAAFSNTILKRFITDSVRDPAANLPRIGATTIMMTGMAAATNYVRTHGDSVKNKDDSEIVLDAIARWGGNGLIFDQYKRASKASEVYRSSVPFVTGLGGPILGDIYRTIKVDSPISTMSQKFVPYTAIEPILGEKAKDEYDDFFKDKDKKLRNILAGERNKYRPDYSSGGIVEFFKVPNAPEVPRERIDKMTGQTYDEQSKDEDPLNRLGFNVGGKILGKLIKQLAIKDIDDDAAEQAAEELRKRSAVFADTRNEQEEIIADRVKAVMEGRSFTNPQDLDYDIEDVLDSIGARERPEDSFVKARSLFNMSQSVRKGQDTSPEIERDKIKNAIGEMRASQNGTIVDEDLAEQSKVFSRLLLRMPKTKQPLLQSDLPDDRSKSLRKFLKDSKVKKEVFRATGDGIETDFEINFAFPRELGPHFGTEAQATDILDLARVPQMQRGYLNIKNPLVVDRDYGVWDAVNLLTDKEDLQLISKQIAKQTGEKASKIEDEIAARVKPSVKAYYRIMNRVDLDGETYSLAKHTAQANANVIFKKYLQTKGFDGVKYLNKGEGKTPASSFIAFEPQQFKRSFASEFNPDDPRSFKYGGGKILKSLSFRNG